MNREQPARATMPLSEAIRLGAMLTPQTHGSFFRKRGQQVETCALGAAFDAVGANVSPFLSCKLWPILDVPVHKRDLPSELRDVAWFGPEQSLRWTIMGLNDFAEWTRSEIADWVEQFEKSHVRESGISSRSCYGQESEDGESPLLCAR
jgi:hypothetical protein